MSKTVRFAAPAAVLAGSLFLAVPAAHAAVAHAAVPQTAAASCSQSYLPLPDPACTPGATNPDVTQDTIGSTICTPGWTKTIRPPVTYTNQLKQQGIADYGYSDTNMSDYEEDHFLPLELGGAPRDPKNLWPEPHSGNQNSYSKDSVENAVKKAVCAGNATLADAQHAMLTNWTNAESVLGIG
ncbi:hypothetical protein [Amycolatopsis benzoatilytica]|uniref:hypothetical protein n=1 Tax=Amycolatopsis benzoatilytica TaxID=346045 RepID=UPI000372D038|nr:hypothetical protein [Amycolatopsis benzoatilytica]